MAYINIKDKVPGDTDPEKRKVLYTDINQLKGALQDGTYDIKPLNIYQEGNEHLFNGGVAGFRFNSTTGKMELSNDSGTTWTEINSQQNEIKSFIAGEPLNALDVVYINTSDGKVYKCDKDDYDKIDWIGISKDTVSSAGVNVDVYTNNSIVGGFSGLTVGEWYSIGSAGSIELGDTLPVGVAIDSNNIKLIKQMPGLRNYDKLLLSYTGTDLDEINDNSGRTKEYVIGTISKDDLYGLNYISINLNTFCWVNSTGDASYFGSIAVTISISNDGGSTYADIVSGDVLTKGYNMRYENTFNYLKNYELTSTDKSNGITIKIKIEDHVYDATVSHENKGIHIYGWR